MKISVLMVIRNEEAHIIECLRSLNKQSLRSAEVLVVDHKSTDKSFSLVQAFQAHHPELNLKLVQRDGNHLGRSRQELLSMASYPLVAFIDGDCIAPKNWLAELYKAFTLEHAQDENIIGVGGPNRLPASTRIHEAINLALDTIFGLSRSPQAFKPKNPTECEHLATTNCLLLKRALYSVGGFSPHFASYGEDLELGQRLRNKNYRLKLLPQPVVINNCAENFSEWLSRMFRFGQAQAQLHHSTPASTFLNLPALFLPVLLLTLGLAVIFKIVTQALLFYLLLSLISSVVLTRIKSSSHLSLPFWITTHLSPLAYSVGYWQKTLSYWIGTLRRQKFLPNVRSHLKRGPLHIFSLLVGMLQSLFQTRTDTH